MNEKPLEHDKKDPQDTTKSKKNETLCLFCQLMPL